VRLTVNGCTRTLTVEPLDNLLAARPSWRCRIRIPRRATCRLRALADNLCRCGTYPKTRKAIKLAARRARNR